MLAKRIIACLDIKDGRTVKGIHFEDLKDAGDPVELGCHYSREGADELVFLDITATNDQRKTLYRLVRDLASHIDIPFTVGGGISTLEDISVLLQNGADKVSINTSAFKDPSFITRASREFGSQCIVLAIDAKKETDGEWYVYLNGGRIPTGVPALDWARRAVASGAGEILLTSMSHDGAKNGFAIDITRQCASALPVPVIASGGAGTMDHFVDVFGDGMVDAALAASVFHFKEIEIPRLKNYLSNKNIPVRK